VLAVLVGIGLIIFGFKSYKISIALIVGIGVTAASAFISCYTPVFLVWIILYVIFCIFTCDSLVVSLGLGVLLVFLFTRKFLMGTKIVIGAVGGIVIAVLLNPLSFAYIHYYVFFPVATALGIVGAFIGIKKFKLAYFCTLNLLASYLVLRGLSAFIGYFPSSIEFRREYTNSEINVISLTILGFPHRSSNLFSTSTSSRNNRHFGDIQVQR
jgi:hypothetical protein